MSERLVDTNFSQRAGSMPAAREPAPLVQLIANVESAQTLHKQAGLAASSVSGVPWQTCLGPCRSCWEWTGWT